MNEVERDRKNRANRRPQRGGGRRPASNTHAPKKEETKGE